MTTDPIADSYGGVLVSGGGRVLLREPSNHFGGYVWTFAKGRPDAGEAPQAAALREVYEETGYTARILAPIPGVFRGTLGINAFWLMDALHPPVAPHHETQRVRWVGFDEARRLIGMTRTPVGRKRDWAILAAAEQALAAIGRTGRPAVQPEDWEPLQPMPGQRARLPLDLAFDASAMVAIRRGLHPTEPEHKWFAYFTGERLRLHRSWTGILVYDVGFAPAADGSARAFEVIVNREPDQHGNDDDREDLGLLGELIHDFLVHGR